VGIREMHSTTTGRAALVVLVPIGLFMAAVGLVVGALFLGHLT
jgi:ABC-type Co2+ transport system permease subunit